jgi:pimeloyl-ACP methyl ester carboxylesterase
VGMLHESWRSRQRIARRIRQPVLLIHARCDPTVPYQQAVTFHARHAASRLLALRDGADTAYVHCPVDPSDLDHWYREER